jgi:MFS transporter, UMF1 family
MSSADTPPRSPATRGEIVAWAMYDWAHSAYSTLLITIVVGYLTKVVLPGGVGELAYGWGIGVSTLLAAVLSPVIGAIADERRNKRTWLAIAAFGGAGASLLMAAVPPELPWIIVALFFTASLCFEIGWSVSNGFLPELSNEKNIDNVSAVGFAFGYVGGGLALLSALGIVMAGDKLGLPAGDENLPLRLRIGLAVMGLWWGFFAIPAVVVLRDRGAAHGPPQRLVDTAKTAIGRVLDTLRNVRRYRTLFLFLIGYLLFNDGVQTVINSASIFAMGPLKMSVGELTQVVLMIQFAAMPGTFLVSALSKKLGQKTTLMLCLAMWVVLIIAAFFVTTSTQFWCMAFVLAMIMGGTQSVSRAIMGVMTPPSRAAEFFGFFNFSGRATSMIGPPLFGTITYATGSAHWGIVSLLIFFITGWAIVAPVNIRRGQQEAIE